jgi:hypothetical protein
MLLYYVSHRIASVPFNSKIIIRKWRGYRREVAQDNGSDDDRFTDYRR